MLPIEKPRFVLLARPDAALLAPLMKLLLMLDDVPAPRDCGTVANGLPSSYRVCYIKNS